MTTAIVIVLSSLLFVFSAWKEIIRVPGANRLLRVITLLIAIASFACLVLPVSWNKKIRTNDNAVVVLTSGIETVDTTSDAMAGSRSVTTITADEVRQFIGDHPLVNKAEIRGNGLTEKDLLFLREKKITTSFTPSQAGAGFQWCNWPRTTRLNEPMEVQGLYRSTAAGTVTIRLEGLGLVLDSVISSGGQSVPFRFRYTPSHTGATLLELTAADKSGRIVSEKIPVQILPSVPLQVLMLSSSPDFESKFLATWLYEHHYKTAIRSTTGPGRYTTRFLNMPSGSITQLTQGVLKEYDLVIAGDEAIAALGPAEKAVLRAEINSGLGLIIQTDSSRTLSDLSAPFALSSTGNQARRLLINGSPAILADGRSYQIGKNEMQVPLVTDNRLATVAAARLYGAGKVVLNTITDTYSWQLSGDEPTFSSFWTLLIGQASRRKGNGSAWALKEPFPVADAPVIISLMNRSDSIPLIRTSNGQVYPEQNELDPAQWTATWWPRTEGWQQLAAADSCTMFVFGKNDWVNARAVELRDLNLFYAGMDQPVTNEAAGKLITLPQTVPKWIFFLLMIASCTYLWFEAKRNRL